MQGHIIEVMADAILVCNLPLKVLIASRPETDIRSCLDLIFISSLSVRLPLESSFETDEDIRVYFEHEFQKIRYASTEAVHPILLAR